MLSLQDRTAGAFMDPRYPYFTYVASTMNMVDALAELAEKTRKPRNLK